MKKTKITFLIDNHAAEDLAAEWGLAIYIEYNGHNLLLDTGASGQFAENAIKLGIDLNGVECGVLSHAHFDHADGLDTFFSINDHAPFYIQNGSAENCFEQKGNFYHYIGIRQGTLCRYQDRIIYTEGVKEILPGVYLIPHAKPAPEVGVQNHMVVYRDGTWQPDDFIHEQSLVLKTEAGLVILNSCSHIGVEPIIDEVRAVFPGESICAYIGGFHLYETADDVVRNLAEKLKILGVQQIVTGHCTGDRAFEILKEVLGDRISGFHAGKRISV